MCKIRINLVICCTCSRCVLRLYLVICCIHDLVNCCTRSRCVLCSYSNKTASNGANPLLTKCSMFNSWFVLIIRDDINFFTFCSNKNVNIVSDLAVLSAAENNGN